MFHFLRRVSEFLGQRLKADAKPASKPAGTPQPGQAAAAGARKESAARGRGTGRGITPPAKPKGGGQRRPAKK